MSRDGGTASPGAIGYWSGGRPRRHPLVVSVVALNFSVALISILFSGIVGLESFGRARHMWVAIVQLRRTMAAPPRGLPAPVPVRRATSRPSQYRALKPREIAPVIVLIERKLQSPQTGAHLTDAQKQTLTRLLSADPQRLIDPGVEVGSEVPGQLQVVRATLSPEGILTLTINHGGASRIYRTRIDAAGQDHPAPFVSSPVVAAPSQSYIFPQPQPTPDAEVLQSWTGEFHAEVCGVVFCGVSLLLDLVLIASAILLLVSSRKGVALMWSYVVLKLLLVAVAWLLPLTSVFGEFTREIDAVGTGPVVVSAVYPIALIFILAQGVFRSPSLNTVAVSPPNITGAPAGPPPSWKVVGIMSLVVSLGTLALSGYWFWNEISEISATLGRPDAFASEQEIAHTSAVDLSIVSAILFALAMILLSGAVCLLRGKGSGVVLHWIYAGLQIVASVALGGVLVWSISNTPAGMMFFLGAFPGLIGCIYPLLIFVVLRRRRVRA
jgi:hypothetical protein